MHKVRRLDHSIHLITEFFQNLHTDFTLYLDKPMATPRTSLIFKNHQKSEANIKNFKIEKHPSSLTVIDMTKNIKYDIILAVPTKHECYSVCGYCGFCVHTFRCSCNENKFHGHFCVHLHVLSSVRHLLPHFEQPINAQITFFKSVGIYSTPSIDNESHVCQTNHQAQHERIADDDCFEPLPNAVSSTKDQEDITKHHDLGIVS